MEAQIAKKLSIFIAHVKYVDFGCNKTESSGMENKWRRKTQKNVWRKPNGRYHGKLLYESKIYAHSNSLNLLVDKAFHNADRLQPRFCRSTQDAWLAHFGSRISQFPSRLTKPVSLCSLSVLDKNESLLSLAPWAYFLRSIDEGNNPFCICSPELEKQEIL